MPVSPPRPCAKHPRVLLSSGNKCPQCVTQRQEAERLRSKRRRADKTDKIHFYTSTRWRKVRALFIRANPLCVDCKKHGLMVAGSHVDHILNIEDGGDKWDTNNFQTLCKPCHSRKTMKELRARGAL